MGDAIRAFNWAETPLGPIDTWPQALQGVVQMMLSQRQAICLVWGPELTLLYNDAYAPLLGSKEPTSLGAPLKTVWLDVWDGIEPFVARAMSGEGTWSEEMPLTMWRSGYPEETFWTFSYSPLFDGDEIKGMINITLDATPIVMARRSEAALRAELVHRVKNTLAVTTAVVSSTLRHASSLEEARETVATRIAALGKAQEYLHAAADRVDIAEVVKVAIGPHLDQPNRALISGPSATVLSQQAVGISLAIYELATNAVKYGALSSSSGKVHITWDVGEDRSFRFQWREVGGPLVNTPTRKGFGSRLTDTIVASYFAGVGKTTYHAHGVEFVLEGRIEGDAQASPQ